MDECFVSPFLLHLDELRRRSDRSPHTSSLSFPPSSLQYPNRHLSLDQRNVVWDGTKGFTIQAPTFEHIGLFFCQAVVNGVPRQSDMYFVHRPGRGLLQSPSWPRVSVANSACVNFYFPSVSSVSNIMDVYLNSSESMQALKGKRLVLNCTATGELNTRVNITWDYPGKVRPVSNRLFPSRCLGGARRPVLKNLACSLSLADQPQRLHLQEAGETPDAHAVLQHPDRPQAPAIGPGHIRVPRQQRGKRQAEASARGRLR